MKFDIERYLSGGLDNEAMSLTEDELLRNNDMFNSFVELCETSLYNAPPDFGKTVLDEVTGDYITAVSIPFLSKKMCAAVCFCSAAAIMLMTVFGVDLQLSEYINTISFDRLLSTIKLF